MSHYRNEATINNRNRSMQPSNLSLFLTCPDNQLQVSNYDDTILSEYGLERISHVFKSEKSINLLLLQEQNLSYPKCGTDILFRCSNGYVRAHSLIMLKSSLIYNILKEDEENGFLEEQQTIAVNDFKVQHIAKLLFLFYTGNACFAMDERKVFARLLKLFGVREDSFEVAVPLRYSDGYKELLYAKMQDHRLRMGLTKMSPNNEIIEDEYFIYANGSMDLMMNQSTPELGVNFSNEFYCEECKCTFAGCGNLQSHMMDKHRKQVEIPRNPASLQILSYRPETDDLPFSQRYQHPGTSVSARRKLSDNQTDFHEHLIQKTPVRNTHQDNHRDVDNMEHEVIYPQTITSTPSRITTSRSSRQDIANFVCCNICFVIKDSDAEMIMHLKVSHAHIKDFNGKSVPFTLNATNTAKGHTCIFCQDVYIKGIALQDHYQSEHGIIDTQHYTLSPNPKCLICKKEWKQNNQNSSLFLNHVRRCFEKIENVDVDEQENRMKRKSSSVSAPPKKAIPWYKDLGTAVIDVLPQQPPQRILSPISKPIVGSSASHNQKKKKLERNHRKVEKSVAKTTFRVLRGRKVPVPLPSKTPKKQTRQKIENPSAQVEQDDLNVARAAVAVPKQKGKSKAQVDNIAPTENYATNSKKKVKSIKATQPKTIKKQDLELQCAA